ncbi:hypothetical protein HYDPIDRAFT_118781 [Hydnomerulius pinastri MD-312]|uniref:RBR-type E3 ubiquitin transferase n=1 Tax=Hydnomerulius pinastri MD-312 TaxID=994086 RepID=A0A0C9VNI4_9AGAM|nr:hypothetical protein HYDPIDRAFT_118781 [Hydnomerulius pinastri MD-312]
MAMIADTAVEPSCQAGVLDDETELLIARLVLEDIDAVEASRKGKKRDDAPLSDEEIAFQLQASSINSFIGIWSDYRLASSIDRALESDGTHLSTLRILDQAAHDDREAALALQGGRSLPPQTQSQRVLESLAQAGQSSAPPPAHQEDAGGSDVENVVEALEDLHIRQAPQTATSHQPRVDCVICGDRVIAARAFKAPCDHSYCRGCVVDLVQASLRDETLHPLRCCHQELPLGTIFPFISLNLRGQFIDKRTEFTTPSASRVYCPNPTCSTFLGGSEKRRRDLLCWTCGAFVCSQCKNNAHPREDCSENKATVDVKALAASSGWQTCPGCHSIVELSQGCYHITCRCSTQFCYLCSARWKTCSCRQWDEQRLVDDAERRVLNEFGARHAGLRPEIHAERVHRRMEVLRYDHQCLDHTWRFRHGSGECEQCGDFLPVFLMRCTNCQTLACRRCSVNRL